MPKFLSSITSTCFFKDLTMKVTKEYRVLPIKARRYERVLGRMEIFKIWLESDYPDTKLYMGFDSMCKEVIISGTKNSVRLPYKAFLRGNINRAYLKFKKGQFDA